MLLNKLLTGLFMAAGYLLGREQGMVLAFALAAGMNFLAYWNAEAVKAIKMPDSRERLGSQGFDLFPSSPQELAALMKSEYARFGKIVKDAGITPE